MAQIKRMAGKSGKGFTMIELIIVIAIVAILAAITIPMMIGFRNDARDAELTSDVRALALAVVTYVELTYPDAGLDDELNATGGLAVPEATMLARAGINPDTNAVIRGTKRAPVIVVHVDGTYVHGTTADAVGPRRAVWTPTDLVLRGVW